MAPPATKMVDLRSDTISKPTQEMKNAMVTADIGDDVFGEDPTVNELQRYAAELFGKEAALYVTSGTMGNLISVACHCDVRGSEVFVGDKQHIYVYEQGGVSQLCGVILRSLKNNKDGTFNLEDLKSQFSTGSDPHKSITSLIAVENTWNGRVLPISFLKEVRQLADEMKIAVHLDGARLMNAVAAMGITNPQEITKYADSVNICLSKGLCSPVGSVIVGTREFISRARRMRKVLGGGMRQAGMLAASGMISLKIMSQRLHEDHKNAKKFANGLLQFSPKYLTLDIESVQTNMVFFTINPDLPKGESTNSGAEFIRKLQNPSTPDLPIVKAINVGGTDIRMVFYNDVKEEDAKNALIAVKNVFDNWKSDLKKKHAIKRKHC